MVFKAVVSVAELCAYCVCMLMKCAPGCHTQELRKQINEKNEANIAGLAQQGGGHLRVVGVL